MLSLGEARQERAVGVIGEIAGPSPAGTYGVDDVTDLRHALVPAPATRATFMLQRCFDASAWQYGIDASRQGARASFMAGTGIRGEAPLDSSR